MRRHPFLVVVAALMLLGLIVPPSASFAAAQEGTPAAGSAAEDELPPGVTSEFIGGGPVTELPPTPGFMVLVRLTIEPGAVLPADPNDPSGAFVVVEAGTLTLRLQEPATESTLGPGEAFYGAPFVEGELSNEGQEPVVLLLAIIGPEEGEPAATPAP